MSTVQFAFVTLGRIADRLDKQSADERRERLRREGGAL